MKRARAEGESFGLDTAIVIFLSVLLDKENADEEILNRVWGEVNELSDSIAKGYISVADLRNTLKEEYHIFKI